MLLKIFIIVLVSWMCETNSSDVRSLKKIEHDLKGLDITTKLAVKYLIENPHLFDWQFIFPGTKWCGDGDVAEDENDLGFFKETDKCCRDHDFCDDIIFSGESKYNLTNDGKYTRLHCKCDHAFYNCLKNVTEFVSHIIGTTYFNVLGGQCYQHDYEATCIKYESLIGLRKRCVEYSFDVNTCKKWQWFDVLRYVSL